VFKGGQGTIEHGDKVLIRGGRDEATGLIQWDLKELLALRAIEEGKGGEGERPPSQAMAVHHLKRPHARVGPTVTKGEEEAVQQLHRGTGHMPSSTIANCLRQSLWDGVPDWLDATTVEAIMRRQDCLSCGPSGQKAERITSRYGG
jgi:hypothetical protein